MYKSFFKIILLQPANVMQAKFSSYNKNKVVVMSVRKLNNKYFNVIAKKCSKVHKIVWTFSISHV